ncbi:hypothetical protein QZH44_30010 (plasmid) [Pseudomonas corrugata]|uniref:hypothetical protein n=1 Tax=Pseudomonas corrugata TaxID=47879 RepID=UPI003D81413A
MNQLETTVIESARSQLEDLCGALAREEDSDRKDDVSSAYWMLNGLLMLAYVKDSGLGEEAVRELQAIERESATVMSAKSIANEHRMANLFLIGIGSLSIGAVVLASVNNSWVLAGASAFGGLVGLAGFFFSRYKSNVRMAALHTEENIV